MIDEVRNTWQFFRDRRPETTAPSSHPEGLAHTWDAGRAPISSSEAPASSPPRASARPRSGFARARSRRSTPAGPARRPVSRCWTPTTASCCRASWTPTCTSTSPGRTEWEGFLTATRAAAAGGVTTLVDMPLNSIPATTTVAALEAKLAAARGRLFVDCAFWGGVVPGNTGELAGLIDAGVAGFKAFLVPSGVDEFQHVGEHDLAQALPILAARGKPLLVHAELAGPASPPTRATPASTRAIWPRGRRPGRTRPSDCSSVCAARPARAIHVVHLSSAEALAQLAEARARGPAPHRRDLPALPLLRRRGRARGPHRVQVQPAHPRAGQPRASLGRPRRRDVIDMVVSDHSPCTPDPEGPRGRRLPEGLGRHRVAAARGCPWCGPRRGGAASPSRRSRAWICERPAALAGLGGRKGRIAAGYDADLVVFDPDAAFTVEAEDAPPPPPAHALRGHRLTGRVEQTILRGALVYDRGALPSTPRGEALRVASG